MTTGYGWPQRQRIAPPFSSSPLGTPVYLGTTTRAKAVALNPAGNNTGAVLQMGAPQAVTIFNIKTGAVVKTYSPGKDKDGSTTGINYQIAMQPTYSRDLGQSRLK